MFSTNGYPAYSANEGLKPFSFQRRQPGARNVQIDSLYWGLCHAGLRIAPNGLGNTIYPCVPSHEIIAWAIKVGRDMRKFREGQLAASDAGSIRVWLAPAVNRTCALPPSLIGGIAETQEMLDFCRARHHL